MQVVTRMRLAAAMLHIIALCITSAHTSRANGAYSRPFHSASAAAALISEQSEDSDSALVPQSSEGRVGREVQPATSSVPFTRGIKERSAFFARVLPDGSIRATPAEAEKRHTQSASRPKIHLWKISDLLKRTGKGRRNAGTRKHVAFLIDGEILYPGRDHPPKGAKHHEFVNRTVRRRVEHPPARVVPMMDTEARKQKMVGEHGTGKVTYFESTLRGEVEAEKAEPPTLNPSYDFAKLDLVAAALLDGDEPAAISRIDTTVLDKSTATEGSLHTAPEHGVSPVLDHNEERDAQIEALLRAAVDDAVTNPYTTPAVEEKKERKGADSVLPEQASLGKLNEAEGSPVPVFLPQQTREDDATIEAFSRFLQSTKGHQSTAEMLNSNEFQVWLHRMKRKTQRGSLPWDMTASQGSTVSRHNGKEAATIKRTRD